LLFWIVLSLVFLAILEPPITGLFERDSHAIQSIFSQRICLPLSLLFCTLFWRFYCPAAFYVSVRFGCHLVRFPVIELDLSAAVGGGGVDLILWISRGLSTSALDSFCYLWLIVDVGFGSGQPILLVPLFTCLLVLLIFDWK
jgi:hypothetical protein